jgi:hypothetical protein
MAGSAGVTNINEVLDGHVALEVERVDRLYLNAYQKDPSRSSNASSQALQTAAGVPLRARRASTHASHSLPPATTKGALPRDPVRCAAHYRNRRLGASATRSRGLSLRPGDAEAGNERVGALGRRPLRACGGPGLRRPHPGGSASGLGSSRERTAADQYAGPQCPSWDQPGCRGSPRERPWSFRNRWSGRRLLDGARCRISTIECCLSRGVS